MHEQPGAARAVLCLGEDFTLAGRVKTVLVERGSAVQRTCGEPNAGH